MKQLKPKYIGLITGVVMIVALLIAFYELHIPFRSKFQWVVFTIYLAGVIWSLLLFHQKGQSDKKLKDYFSEGFKTFIVAVLIIVVYTFIFVKMNPQTLDSFIEENNKELTAQGNRTQTEIMENAMKIRSSYPFVMAMGVMVIYLVIGALVSLAGAAFLSQKNRSAAIS